MKEHMIQKDYQAKNNTSIVGASVVLALVLSLGTNQVEASQYNNTTANAWCISSMKSILNDRTSGFLSTLNFAESGGIYSQVGTNAWKVGSSVNESSTLCNAVVAAVSNTEWVAGKAAYYTANNNSYLPAGVNNFWTRTPDGTTNAWTVGAGGNFNSTLVTTDTNYNYVPAFYLNPNFSDNTVGGFGTNASPFTLTFPAVAGNQGYLNDPNSGFLSTLSDTEIKYLKQNVWNVGPEGGEGNVQWTNLVSSIAKIEWTPEAKTAYRTALNGSDTGNYTPNGVAAFYTRTQGTSNTQVNVIDAGGVVSSAPSTGDYSVNKLVPAFYLNNPDVCLTNANGGAGTTASPYGVTDQNCNATPTLTITNSGAQIIALNSTGVTISGTVTDADVGQVITISATLAGSQKSTTISTPSNGAAWSLTWSFAELTAGTYNNITFNASDTFTSGTASYTGNIIVDKTAPICNTGIWEPAAGAVPWNNTGTQNFVISGVTDTGGSGIQVSGGNCNATTNGSTCTVSVSDNANNVSTCTSPTAKIDTVVPTHAVTVSPATPDGANNWYINEATVTLAGTDATSGIASAGYSITPTITPSFTSTGTQTLSSSSTSSSGTVLYYQVKDNANLSSTQTSETYKIDLIDPTVDYTNANATDWFVSRDAVVTANDVASGISRFAYSWVPQTTADLVAAGCSDTFGTVVTSGTTLNAPIGANKLQLCVIDNAGRKTVGNGIYLVDSQAPAATQVPVPATPDGAGGFYVTTPTITIAGTDSAVGSESPSGIGAVRFAWDTIFADDNTGWFTGVSTTTSPTNGEHILYYQTRDKAGNMSTVQQATYKLNTTNPTFSEVITGGTQGANDWYTAAPSLTVTGAAGSGGAVPSSILRNYKLGAYDSAFVPSTTAATWSTAPYTNSATPAEGINTDYFQIVDASGNKSNIGHANFKVDLTDPISSAVYINGYTNQNTTSVALTSSDAVSGVASCSLKQATATITNGTVGSFTAFNDEISTECAPFTANLQDATAYKYQLTVTDNAGRTTISTESAVLKTDTMNPSLDVPNANLPWQSVPNEIAVTADDTNSGLARLAYSWDADNLGADCSGGTALTSGTDLGTTQPDGTHSLYVCAKDNAGNITNFDGVYKYAPAPYLPELDGQVPNPDLFWNIVSLVPSMTEMKVVGEFPQTGQVYNYELSLKIIGIDTPYTMSVTTSVTGKTRFEFVIPTADFNAGPGNNTFVGPQVLTITDPITGLISTVDYNVNFYFPIYQINHKNNTGMYILASDTRMN